MTVGKEVDKQQVFMVEEDEEGEPWKDNTVDLDEDHEQWPTW